MTGTCDNIQPSAFKYGRYIYVTWGYVPRAEGGYEYRYIELEADANIEYIRAALESEIEDSELIDTMMIALEGIING